MESMAMTTHDKLQRHSLSRHRWRWRVRLISIGVLALVCSVSALVHHYGLGREQSHTFATTNKLGTLLNKRDKECRYVHAAHDQCAFVRENCVDEEAGLLSYLGLYYCDLANAKTVALVVLLLWLGLLFSTIGIAASDFFSINLSTIATLLGLSESVAGVTFLAFGNGSPDVFSTFAAFNTHSGSLAIGELIGAAGFITAVVAGSMALVRPFKVARRSFIRDVSCFVVAASFSMVFLADGRLTSWECAVMVAFYVAYVIFVVVWQWVVGRNRRKKLKEVRARSHFLSSDRFDQPNDEDDEDTMGNDNSTSRPIQTEDFVALEQAGQVLPDAAEDETQLEAREQWMSEINRNMRIQRPVLGSHRNTGNPIRPSLVGALEFRAVLSSLEKSRNQRAIPIGMRRYSDDPTFTLAQQQYHHSRGRSNPQVDQLLKTTDALETNGPWRPYQDDDRGNENISSRNRAVSANDAHMMRTTQYTSPQHHGQGRSTIHSRPSTQQNESANTNNLTVPGLPEISTSFSPSSQNAPLEPHQFLSIPTYGPVSSETNHPAIVQDESFLQPSSSQLDMNRQSPSHTVLLSPGTAASSPSTPFPPYYDDPDHAQPLSRPHSIRLPPPSLHTGPFFASSDTLAQSRPLRWWPYRILPPPRVLLSTLFPTLYSWKEKSFAERLLGIISAPTIFLLTITLPVVECQKGADPTGDTSAASEALPTLATCDTPAVGAPQRERPPPPHTLEATALPRDNRRMPAAQSNTSTSHFYQGGDNSNTAHVSAEASSEQSQEPPKGWNRWLVSTQIFTAPLFVVLIVWANTDENHTAKNLALYILYALLGSLLVFASLLLTTTDQTAPKYHTALCFVGFVVSVAWISTIAGEVVGVLKALGVILGISDAILGLTIFAVGNSLGDLVADITVAKLGFPIMALSACFGGPMLNILLGIGISGLYMTLKERHGKHHELGAPAASKPYHIEVHGTLIISGISLLITLVGLLIVVPLNKWIIDRKIGWSLVILWTISTIVNVIIEATGMASQMAR